MNLMSINVLYTVLTSWPEVLPNAEINKGIVYAIIYVEKMFNESLKRVTTDFGTLYWQFQH